MRWLFHISLILSNYASDFNLAEVKNCLSADFDEVTKWFQENYVALDAGKYHFMCLGKDTGNETFNFKGLVMMNSKEQTNLGLL